MTFIKSVAVLAMVFVQGGTARQVPRLAAFERHQAMERSSPFGKLTWSHIGPANLSGVALDLAVADRGNRRRIYVAFAFGGVWKTDDNGTTWQVVFTRAAATRTGT